MHRARYPLRPGRLGALLCAVYAAALLPMPRAQTRTPGGADTLGKMSDARLLQEAWAREHIDLNYGEAARAYRKLVAREDATPRLRHQAFVRLIHILTMRGNAAELARLFERLAKEPVLTPELQAATKRWAAVLASPSPEVAAIFAKPARDPKKRKSRGTPIEDAAVAQGRRLRLELEEVLTQVKTCFRAALADARGAEARSRPRTPSASVFPVTEYQEKHQELSELTQQRRTVVFGSPEADALKNRIDAVQRDIRRIVDRYLDSQPGRRARARVKVLQQRVARLEQRRDFERADALIDEIEALHDELPYEFHKRFTQMGRALREIGYRRQAVRQVWESLNGVKRRLVNHKRSDGTAAIEAFEASVRPLIEAKRWDDAANRTLEFLDQVSWKVPQWRQVRR